MECFIKMAQVKKTKLFSITKKDFERSTFKGSGDGGQKRQKTSSGVRFFHRPSGAEGKASDTRSQPQNEKLAFERLTQSKKFKAWLDLEIDCHTGKVKLEVCDASTWTERPIFSNLDK